MLIIQIALGIMLGNLAWTAFTMAIWPWISKHLMHYILRDF